MTNSHFNLSEWLSLGQLATRHWLQQQGMSRHSLDNALKSGKLVALARGVVARPEVPVRWQGVVASLDRILPEAVYVGGLSALSQSGLGHYVSFDPLIHLYSAAPQPTWLSRLALKEKFVWHGNGRLWEQWALTEANSLQEQSMEAGWSWRLASPEQAFLELLVGVPDDVSFEHADNLMQGLSSLSPRRLDVLLRACHHVRVKRLFFFFADRHQYSWRRHLSAEDYDLGVGKRSIVSGGRLNKNYLITVPESFHGSESPPAGR